MKGIFYFSLLFKIVVFASSSGETIGRDNQIHQESNSGISRRALRRPNTQGEPRSLVATNPFNSNRSIGQKELLVIRIEARDSSTTATEEQLFDDVFNGEITFTKQMNSCSHGKLTINPATGQNINNGITTIKLDNVVGKSSDSVVEEVEKDAVLLFGRSLNEFNHVMFCMPYGTLFKNGKGELSTTWHAYVPGDWRYTNFVTIYNDRWCSSISAGMHEVGHNLGLEHSNESGSTYEDETGSMGYSSLQPTFAAMRCYNPSKSWQLGWYSEHSRRINPFIDAPFQTVLTGITRPPLDGDPSRNILLQIPNGQTNIYLGYNLAEGYNAETVEGRNKVLVNEKAPGDRTYSNLLAKLSRGNTYTIKNYEGSGENLVIKVDENFRYSKEALIDVYFEGQDHPEQPGCNSDEVRFEVNIKTDAYAEDTSWKLIDDETQSVVASQSNREFENRKSHDYLVCIDRKRDFTFTLYDDYSDGICCSTGWGAYSIFLDGKEIFHGGEFKTSSVSHTFRTKEQETNPFCRDDPFFRYKRVNKCSWVARDRLNRCRKMWTGKLVAEHCPLTCGLCNTNSEGFVLDVEKTTRNIDDNIFCRDDTNYRYKDEKSCQWVAKDPFGRCSKMWRGEFVREHCQKTCNLC